MSSVGSVRAFDLAVEVGREQDFGRLSHGQCGWRDRAAGMTTKASTLRHKQTPPLLQAALRHVRRAAAPFSGGGGYVGVG